MQYHPLDLIRFIEKNFEPLNSMMERAGMSEMDAPLTRNISTTSTCPSTRHRQRQTKFSQYMKSSKKKFTRKDFLRAWLESREHEGSHEDLRRYYGKVYSAFSQAFKIDLNHLPSEGRESEEDRHMEIFYDFFESVAKYRVSCSSPFDGILVAPRYISGLSRTYGNQFILIQEKCEKLHDKLLLELMEKIWGIKESDKVSQATIDQCGYPTESAPDLSDYY